MSTSLLILPRHIITAQTTTAAMVLPHPFDPLSADEISASVDIVKKYHSGPCYFNVVSLHEPRKAEMLRWLEHPSDSNRPARIADVVVILPDGKVYDGLVDLRAKKVTKWEKLDGLQPIVSAIALFNSLV